MRRLSDMLRSAIRTILRRVDRADRKPEGDVPTDPAVARSRETGGDPDRTGTAATTTGPGENETYVGRVAGQDAGYADETGAEKRRFRDRKE